MQDQLLAMVRKMPMISFTEAAKIAGVNPSTIHRAVKDGRLSCVTLDNDRKAVDPTELERVFPSNRPRNGNDDAMPLQAKALLDAKEEQIAALHALVRALEMQCVDLKTRLDESETERRQTTRLLTDQRPRRSWWHWARKAA